MKNELATFAAGCFWGVEELFRSTEGVLSTRVGYIGGNTEEPSYEEVCSGETNHAEAIEVEFDPKLISYTDLLNLFWENHNPTTLNQQGPDRGTQYRSAIFYHNQEQQELASASKHALDKAKKWSQPIVTEITKASVFWPAEEYHQKYLFKKGASHCSF